MDDTARIDRLEMRLTEQDATLEALDRAVTEQWGLIDRLIRQVSVLREQVEAASAHAVPRGPEPPPPHY